MNTGDPFEERLRRQQLRQVPPNWRSEILSAARPAAAAVGESAGVRDLLRFFSQWLWPNPRAWAGLAAAWVVVFTLNFVAREEPAPSAALQAPGTSSAPPHSPQMREMLRQQNQLLAELVGPAEPTKRKNPEANPISPQGRRPVPSANA